MAKVEQAKQALLDKLNTLVLSTGFEQNDTITAVQALDTIEKSIDEEAPVAPPPQYHYRSTRPEFAVWSAHYSNCAGATVVDRFGVPQRQRAN